MIFGPDQSCEKLHAPHMFHTASAPLPAFSVFFSVGRVPFSDRIGVDFDAEEISNIDKGKVNRTALNERGN